MNMIYKEGYGCVFSLNEYNQLTYAPLYENGTVNLNEFDIVDMDMIDMDDMEVFNIREELRRLDNPCLLTTLGPLKCPYSMSTTH